MFVVAMTLGPLVVARASTDSSGWSGLFDFLVMSWLVEIVAALAGALLMRLLKDARRHVATVRTRGRRKRKCSMYRPLGGHGGTIW
jgi:hypothetical protein